VLAGCNHDVNPTYQPPGALPRHARSCLEDSPKSGNDPGVCHGTAPGANNHQSLGTAPVRNKSLGSKTLTRRAQGWRSFGSKWI